ncbi:MULTISPECIES: hypothetical protein [Pseudomonas]|uniref:hypothetical protein n=1 Tax=Pseudomonas TaxID=286 RepID=UPI001E3A7077|nr:MULTISPECIES: hypothetical protein [Pseudomonas]
MENGNNFVTDGLGQNRRYYWGAMYEAYKYIEPSKISDKMKLSADNLKKSIGPQAENRATATTISAA